MPLATTPRPDPGARKPIQDPDDFRAPLHEHLDELRARIIRSLAFLTFGWVVGWPIANWMNTFFIAYLMGPIRAAAPKGTTIATSFISVTEPFMVLLRQSFMIGICISLPFIVAQIWGFVAPGLKESERKPIQRVLPVSIGLFFMGVGFCWIVLPSAFSWFSSFLGSFSGSALNQNPEQLITFAVKMMAAFGICFQLPLIVYVLGRVGILSPQTMLRYWRHATVFIFFVAGAITPSNDPFSMLMMAIPLCILFVISVYAVQLTTKNKAITDSDLPPLD